MPRRQRSGDDVDDDDVDDDDDDGTGDDSGVWNFDEFSPEKFLEFSGIDCEDVEVVGVGRV